MHTYNIYIGSNNATKKLEYSKIKRLISKHFAGYSLAYITGFWQGKPENEKETRLNKVIVLLA